MELKLRKAQINNFFSTKYQIIKVLGRCSQYIANIEQAIGMKTASETNTDSVEAIEGQLNFKLNEPCESENTAQALNAERFMLLDHLQKIDQLEIKVTEELEAFKTKIITIESGLKKFNEISSNTEPSEERKASLLKEIEKLKETRESLAALTSQLEAQCMAMEANLNSNETHIQLCILEKRLATCKERKQALLKVIETKKYASDFSSTAMKAKSLLANYNEALKMDLRVKPIAL
nr:intraflagellar transport protein 74 [Hymenolepis microstoma]